MAKESAMVQIETKITCGLRFISLNGHCWFPVAPFVQRCNLCNPPVLPCPGKAKLGEDHPRYFEKPQQSRGAPRSPGAPGGGRASLPRGSREEPGSLASKISKGLWAVDLESHLIGLSLGN